MLSGSEDGTVRVWDVQTERETCRLNPRISVNSVAWAPQGLPYCLTGGDENFARLWDLEKQQEVRRLQGHTFLVLSVAFTPDGKQAVTGSADRTIRIWDVATGQLQKTLIGHDDRVTSVAVSSDGTFLLSGGADGTVRRWNLRTGQLERTFAGHWGAVRGVAISADGTRGLSGGDDTTLRVWKLADPAASRAPPAASAPLDLLSHIHTEKDAVHGQWVRNELGLFSPGVDQGRLQIHASVPEEYQLKVVVTRLDGEDMFTLGLVTSTGQVRVMLDGYGGKVSGLELVRKTETPKNGIVWNGTVLPKGRPNTILCTVRKRRVLVEVNGRAILDWSGSPEALSMPDWFKVPDPRALVLDDWSTARFQITEIKLQALPNEETPAMLSWSPAGAALAKARDLIDGKQADSPEFQHALQTALPSLQMVRSYQNAHDLAWQKLTLNVDGTGFGAVRFRSPFEQPADLRLAFAVAGEAPAAQVLPAQGALKSERGLARERNLELEDVPLPMGSTVTFQNLNSGAIQPGQDYLVWFRFPHTQPVELHLALQLVPAGSPPIRQTSYGIAEALGIPVPLRYLNRQKREASRSSEVYHPLWSAEVSSDAKSVLVVENHTRGDSFQPLVASVLNLQTGEVLHELKGHTNDIWCAAFSPDGRRALTGGRDRTLRLWDLQTGGELRSFGVNNLLPLAIAFLPDGRRAATVGGGLRVWDTETGRLLRSSQAETTGLWCLELINGGKEAVTGGSDGVVRIWDLETCLELRHFRTGGRITCVRASPDGQSLAVADTDSPVIDLWNLKTGECIRQFKWHDSGVLAVAFSPDGSQLLSSAGQRHHFFWDPLPRLRTDYRDFDAAAPDRSIRLWDVENGRELLRIDGHHQYVPSIAFSTDGKLAISGGGDGTVRVWALDRPPQPGTIEPAPPAHIFTGHQTPVSVVAFTADGQHALSGSGITGTKTDSTIRIWDLAERRELRQFTGHQKRIMSVSSAPGGRLVLSASEDGNVQLWDSETLQPLPLSPQRPARYVCFATDGHHALCGGAGVLELRGLQDAADYASFNFSSDHFIAGLALDHAQRRAVTCGNQAANSFPLWDLARGQVVRWFEGHTGGVQGVAIASYGRRVVSAGQDGTVRLWDTETGAQLNCFTGHAGAVLSVAISPDAQYALSGGVDRSVRLWDLQAGVQVWQGAGHSEEVHSVAFGPDGTQALSGAADQRVCLWQLPTRAADDATERSTAEWVLAQGGTLEVEIHGLSYRFAGKAVLPPQPLTVSGVSLAKNPSLGDAQLARLADLKGFKSLDLSYTPLRDEALDLLGSLQTLEFLNLAGTKVSASGLKRLAPQKRLHTLNLTGLPIDATGLRSLSALVPLRHLTLSGPELSVPIVPLLKEFHNLDRLELQGARSLDADAFQELRLALPYCRASELD